VSLFQTNLNPSRNELRWFGMLWFPAFCVLAGLSLYRRGAPSVAVALWLAAVVTAVAGMVDVRIVAPIYRWMIRLTYPIGWIVSHVIVAVSYFLVVTPIGYLMRLSHDPMRRGFDRSAKSYWVDCEPSKPDRYFRQF
jgi:Saxitoxin biosynthesis operon protein SxtJ